MYIDSLNLKNFRNYKELDIKFSPDINIIYGDNAQGKTNIIEAIYVCSTTKSHRGAKDREMINFNDEDAHIKMNIVKKGMKHKIDMHLKKNKFKGAAIDGIVIKKSSELLGWTNVVVFSPEDLSIIKRGPAERRRFIDIQLCQIDKIYLKNIINYNKLINERNIYLKQMNINDDKKLLDVFDMQLVKYGCEIIKERRVFIEKLNRIISSIHFDISNRQENIDISYENDVDEKYFYEKLVEKREKDIKTKITSAGPHRDDMKVCINNIDARRFGSQGQQRTAALSMKLGEIELIKEETGVDPVLLLDDVLSELDENRKSCLFEKIKGIQTMITCTGLEDFMEFKMNKGKKFKVLNGNIEDNGGL